MNETKRGKFVVIEGIDGCGKTTQVEMLKARMKAVGIPAVVTREASDGPIGKLLREVYLTGKRKADERIINYLYFADRLDHITNEEDGMLKYLNAGQHVLCDRYYLSSMAYYAMEYYGTPYYGLSMREILEQNKVNRNLLVPDVCVYIRVHPDIAMRRLAQSHRTEGLSIYETEDRLKKIYAAYDDAIAILQNDDEYIIEVDGEDDAASIHHQICDIISVIPELRALRIIP